MSLELIQQDDERMVRLCASVELMNERDLARRDTRARVAWYLEQVRHRAWSYKNWETILNQQVAAGLMTPSEHWKKLKRLQPEVAYGND
jgi:hypothetical protein